MVPDISNTSQSLIVNTYYLFKCNEKDRTLVNKEIEKKYSMSLIMNLMSNISKTLDTNILHTSSHSFEPNGVSLTSVIESNEPMFGSSGVAHLRESHMSFHSYYENSLKDIIIMRLELHIPHAVARVFTSLLMIYQKTVILKIMMQLLLTTFIEAISRKSR